MSFSMAERETGIRANELRGDARFGTREELAALSKTAKVRDGGF